MSDKTEEQTEPYFHLSKNEHGKMWLMYKPEGGGRYKCWEPINEEFWNEFSNLINKEFEQEKELASLREQLTNQKQEFGNVRDELLKLNKERMDEIISLREQLTACKDEVFRLQDLVRNEQDKLKCEQEVNGRLTSALNAMQASRNERDDHNQELKNALKDLISIVDYYHIRSVKYTEMPYKNWNAVIDKAKNLSV